MGKEMTGMRIATDSVSVPKVRNLVYEEGEVFVKKTRCKTERGGK